MNKPLCYFWGITNLHGVRELFFDVNRSWQGVLHFHAIGIIKTEPHEDYYLHFNCNHAFSDGTIWSWGKTMDIIRYCTKYRDTIRYTVTKRSAECNGQQSKINAAFSLTPWHAFACVQTPSTVVDDTRTLSVTFGSGERG